MAALAIKSDAQDSLQDSNSSTDSHRRNRSNDNAFAEIMANRTRTTSTSRTHTSATTTTATKTTTTAAAIKPSISRHTKRTTSKSLVADSTLLDSLDATAASNLVPDLEDLVADAARVRIASGKHARTYHRFTTQRARKQVHDHLLAWYDIHHRKLPWRCDYVQEDPVAHKDASSSEKDVDEQAAAAAAGQRAYEVWVSEIMCQQTQVATVIPYYNTWMAKWPTLADLAAADIEDVNKVWTGLGYYSRASRLHLGAQKVLKQFKGILPRDPVLLEKEVPGVGRYTAGAIVSHAYNVPAELVDGNVIRVLSRLRAIGGDVKSPKVIDLHWLIAKELVHQDRPGCFNQSLMELGAVICTPQNPKCDECPVQTSCRAYAETLDARRSRKEALGTSQKRNIEKADEYSEDDDDDACQLCLPESQVEGKDQGLVTQYPRKAAKKAPRDEECAVSILERVRKDTQSDTLVSEFLLVKRPDKGLLAGMWEFPTVEQDQLRAHNNNLNNSNKEESSTYQQRSSSSRKYLTETLGQNWIDESKSVQLRDLGSVQHLFSHIRKVYHVEWVLVSESTADVNSCAPPAETETEIQGKRPELVWLTAEELASAAIPTGINKTFQLLQKFKAEFGGHNKDLLVESHATSNSNNNTSSGGGGQKRRKTDAGLDGGAGKNVKKVKKEEGLANISNYFKVSSK
ncbi:hypothetical protein BGZ70_000384 [Mortierella alpina]|uniref:Adenine DNA glycosylase n=1 Tax=Mortierella alpina TaxID=64518 RepID=A0A9P6IYE3_MORAP|nr:hypothetical protein BGZ70_000384 [Mortierella alpina]